MKKVTDATTESMKEAATEVVLIISLVRVIAETEENLPKGMIEIAEVVGSPCSVGGVEVVELQWLAIPASGACPMKVRAEVASLDPLSSSAADSLRIVAEFLGSHLAPMDRRALDGEGTQHQLVGAFRSLALIGHYLANFTRAISGFSPELVEEMINRRDDELSRTHQRIEILERQRSEADWDYRRAHDVIKRLKRMLTERRGSSSEAHPLQKSGSLLSKRPKSSGRDHYEEEASRRSEVFSFGRGSVAQKLSTELQIV
ncbi:hypothetical protein COCNU_14G011190 [Cocos nucifera]|uniref:Uncharacterized protein n=1 Tax=Cocos nucifera TaxID=13894 RepID=A0A8K0NCA3_COCNU|nr:hypothetical protein COCNU_14G011190 [Cocos nucifera]